VAFILWWLDRRGIMRFGPTAPGTASEFDEETPTDRAGH
jgi:hypothetical protein